MMDERRVSESLAAALEKVRGMPDVEVECRLGRIVSGGRFVAGVPAEAFDRVRARLSSNPKWSSVIERRFHDVFAGGKRIRFFEDNGKVECVRKEKLFVLDVPCGKVDVRLCISREIPEPPPRAALGGKPARWIQRLSMRHKMWSFELSHVAQSEARDKDDDRHETHEVEVEMVEPLGSYPSKYIADYAVLLCKDLVGFF